MRIRLPAAFAATLLASALIVAGGAAAEADTMTTCGAELDTLQSDVLAVPITSGKVDKERAGLVKLVTDATALVDAGKTTDALVKLANLQAKIDTLEEATRISTESAALLSGDTTAATECLSAG